MPGDSRLDDLFALPPDAFTEARDELAKEMRAAGDKDGAAAVKALRRPTLAAWALNQLARQDRDGLWQLREAGEALAREQRRAMSGLDHSGLRAAQQARRQVTDEVLARAVGVLRESDVAPDPHVDALRDALHAAALDTGSGQSLLEGRLSRPPEPPSGFGALSGLAPVATDDAPAGNASAHHTRVAEARGRLEAAQAEARARARRADADAASRDDSGPPTRCSAWNASSHRPASAAPAPTAEHTALGSASTRPRRRSPAGRRRRRKRRRSSAPHLERGRP